MYIFYPDKDDKTKNVHVRDMMRNQHHQQKLPLRTVIIDTSYVTQELMLMIEELGKSYYCPPKSKRQADDGCKTEPYKATHSLV